MEGTVTESPETLTSKDGGISIQRLPAQFMPTKTAAKTGSKPRDTSCAEF